MIAQTLESSVHSLALALVNPVATPIHALGLIGLALMMAADETRRRRAAMLSLGLGLCVGLSAVAAGSREPPAAVLLIACVIASSGLAAAAIRAPAPVVFCLAFATGVLIGLDSPPRVLSLRLAIAMLIATGIGAMATVIVLTELLAACLGRWRDVGVRVAGSWVAASAILALAARVLR